MVQWQCKLRTSLWASCVAGMMHTAATVLLLLAKWPENTAPLWLLLLGVVLWEGIRSQQRIRRCSGVLVRQAPRDWYWREQHWWQQSSPWLTPWAILLPLRNQHGKKIRLWLFADAMPPQEWRLLRQYLLMSEGET